MSMDLMGPDALQVARTAARIGRGAVDAIESSLPGAIAGDRQEVRAYVTGYRELTGLILEAVDRSSGGDTYVDIPWLRTVLEREAMSAPFTDWVGTLGIGEGTAVGIVAMIRDLLPGMESLQRSAAHRLPEWDLDEPAVPRFYRAVLDELERSQAPLDRIREVLGVNRTELAVLFGVRRQALDQWIAHGVPVARQEKLATVGEIADLLAAKLKADRIPGVVRRPASAYAGRSALAAIAAGDQDLVLAELRDAFDWGAGA